MYGRRNTTVAICIPSGLGVGQIIGKHGSNIKHLSARSCARMSVDTVAETVRISGNETEISLAVRLLDAQFKSWRSSAASAYPHPTEVKYIVKEVESLHSPLTFAPVSPDVVTQATERPERLYRLQSKLTARNKTVDTCSTPDISMLSSSMARMMANKDVNFHTGDNEYKVLDGMVAAARQVVNATPKLAELKVTFNLGSQFFYAGRGMQVPDSATNLTLNKMNTMQLSGQDATLKSVYSNAVRFPQFKVVKQYVACKANFKRVALKTTASVHVKNKDLNTSLVVAFIRSSEKLTLRKLKSGAVKPFFTTFVRNAGSQDVRLKLTGQNHFAENGPEVTSMAGIIARSTIRNGALLVPCSSSQEVDKARIKTKEVYEGSWKGYTIRIAFNIIQGNDGQEHCEVTGRMPQLNSNLQAALEEGAPVKDLLAEARTALQVLAQFCSELATV